MYHLDDGHPILYTVAGKYLSLTESTIEDEQKSQKEYKDHKINFNKWICYTEYNIMSTSNGAK